MTPPKKISRENAPHTPSSLKRARRMLWYCAEGEKRKDKEKEQGPFLFFVFFFHPKTLNRVHSFTSHPKQNPKDLTA